MNNVQATKIKTSQAVRTWAAAVRAGGGGFQGDSLVIASRFMLVLQTKSYYSKIKYLLPMLGVGMGAARAPLVDVLGAGLATNVSFVDADFSQSTGLQGNGSSKYLNSLIKPSDIGSSNNGGLGYWENNISFGANVEPVGAYNAASTNSYVLDLRGSLESFRWGAPGNSASTGSSAVNAHYYGQRSSSTSRELFRNGASLATNSTSDATAGANETNMAIVGALEPGAAPWPGRCAVAYFTDGAMSAIEITDFNVTLRDYLMVPTGKPQS